jgi:predicted metal-dependent phosphoesterase TrpH
MCDDGPHIHAPPHARALSRRGLLQGMVALAALAGCGPDQRVPQARPPVPPLTSRPPSPAGLSPFVMGMHLHASASEGEGSVHSQLRQAAAHGYDVAWFTEHDWRRRRLLFRSTYSFVPGEMANGGPWELERRPDEGSLTRGSGGAQVSDPVSPGDPASPKASLRIRATGAGDDSAAVTFRVQAKGGSRTNFRSRIAGRVEKLDVLAVTGGPDAWGEVLLSLSHHPASGGRPEGVYGLRYRFRTDVVSRAIGSAGLTGVVDVPVPAGRWQTVTLDPVADLTAIYPDLDARDHSLHDIEFRGVSRRRAAADVCFGHLRFEEQDGYDAVGVEEDLVARYAEEGSGVLGLIGSEISLGPHLNHYGGEQAPYDYGPIARLGDKPGDDAIPSVVEHIHRNGGLASINHPGVSVPTLLALQAGGADMIEVGYGSGGPNTVQQQLGVWDTLSRNGLFLTGNGASDDHSGQGWEEKGNRYYTAAWTTRLAQPELLDALGRGRAFVGYLGSFAGTLDMSLDGTAPMGSVVVGPTRARTLRIDVTGLPEGGAVQVVRGPVDRAGTADPTPGTAVVRTLGAADLERRRDVPLDVSGNSFHRLQVTDRNGAVVAYGQPIWLLDAAPPGGVPARRLAG